MTKKGLDLLGGKKNLDKNILTKVYQKHTTFSVKKNKISQKTARYYIHNLNEKENSLVL